jgi:hypothetical protein
MSTAISWMVSVILFGVLFRTSQDITFCKMDIGAEDIVSATGAALGSAVSARPAKLPRRIHARRSIARPSLVAAPPRRQPWFTRLANPAGRRASPTSRRVEDRPERHQVEAGGRDRDRAGAGDPI